MSRLDELTTLLIEGAADREPGLYTPAEGVLDIDKWINPPNVIVQQGHRENLDIVFPELEVWRAASAHSAMSVVSESWPQERISRLRHDYTAGYFSRTLDYTLKDFFQPLRDDSDHLTPDVITTRGDVVIVHEFTTTRYPGELRSVEAYRQKILRYAPALNARAMAENKVVILTVTVISPRSVLSNLPLEMDDAIELCMRLSLANNMVWQLQQQGLLISEEEVEEKEQAEKARRSVGNIKFNWDRQNKDYPSCSEQVYLASLSEPDMEYVARQTVNAFLESRDKLGEQHLASRDGKLSESRRLDLNLEECVDHIQKTVDEINKGEDFKATNSLSSVIPVPWWVLRRGNGSNNISESAPGEVAYYPDLGYADEVTFRHWRSAWLYASMNSEKMQEESIKEELQMAMNQEIKLEGLTDGQRRTVERITESLGRAARVSDVKTKSSYRRVEVDVDKADELEAAKRGIKGKKYSKNPDVKEHLKHSRKPMRLDHFTQDIEEAMDFASVILGKETSSQPSYDECTLPPLAEQAYALHGEGVGDPWVTMLKDWLRTDLGKWSSFVSDLGTELAISMKQGCKGKKFILKKLRHFDVYVLIRTTSSKSSLFYSLMTFKSHLSNFPGDSSTIFKQSFENDQVVWTEFTSVDSSKLMNMVKCKSIMFSMLAYWMEFNGLKFWEVNLQEPSKEMEEVWKMMMVCLMVTLDDKTKTEEIITTSRYVFMEGFVSQPALPKPHKVLNKLPKILRSRLQVWLMHRIFDSMKMVSNHPFSMTWEEGRPIWLGMFNMFTLNSLKEPMQLISCFYVGYLKNKEESPQGNSSSKLYEKVMEYESRRPETDENLGWGDPEFKDVKFHEFSRSILLHCSDLAMEKLKKMYGDNVKKEMTEDILQAIGSYDLEEFATLKASATYNKDMYDYDPKKTYHRAKVVEFVARNSDKATHVHELLQESLEFLERNGCMHIDLFKKAQHGGIREIYVLGPNERLVQLCLELIARTICKRFPSETMMNPKNKFDLPQRHNKDAKAKCGPEFVTTSTSDDAAKWNQGHFVSKFAMLLCRFTEPVLHPFIMRACGLFTKKVIKIDDQLLKIFSRYEERTFKSDLVEMMHAAFRGRGEPTYRHVEPGKTFLRTETGMLQGILHYASSLLHTVYQEFIQDTIEDRMKKMLGVLKEKNTTLKSHVTIMQSSDDSSVMVSFPLSSRFPHSERHGKSIALLCFQFKKEMGLLLGIYPSEKCTTGTPWVTEFNSEFFFLNDLIRPLFRWIAACTGLSEHETLAGRQEEMSSNLSNILGGGGTTSLTASCQLAQMMLHYQILGAGVSLVFSHYTSVLTEIPDPSLGFFLLDHPFLAGIGGFKYNLYLAVKKTKLGNKYKEVLTAQENVAEDRLAAGLRARTLETTKAGSIVESTIISMATRKKWENLVNKMGLPESWKEDVLKDQRVLYEKARTPGQLKIRLAVFMHSPGVISSISTSGAVVRLVASSVYALTKPVVQDRTDWYCEATSLYKKQSLLCATVERCLPLEANPDPISPLELQALFPQREDYDDLQNVGDNFTAIQGSSVRPNRARITTRVQVTGHSGKNPVTLLNLVEDRWYGRKRYMVPPRTMDQLWQCAKQRIPWLELTDDETLASSPFQEATALHNFIVGDPIKSRVVAMSGVPVKRGAGMSNVFTMVAENFAPNFKLSGSTDVSAMTESNHFLNLRHAIALLAHGPFKATSKLSLIKEVLTNNASLLVDESAARTRRNCLAIMQDFAKTGDRDRTIEKIQNHRLGSLGSYSLPQRYLAEEDANKDKGEIHGYYGKGVWRGTYDKTSIEIHIDRELTQKDVNITGILVSSASDLNNVFRFLKEWAKENGCINDLHFKKPPAGLHGHHLTRMFRFSSCSSGSGVPVVVDSRFRMGVDSGIYRNLELTFRRNVLRITAYHDNPFGSSKESTLLSYVCRDSDINLSRRRISKDINLPKVVMNSYTSAWMDCLSMIPDHFDVLERHILRLRANLGPGETTLPESPGILDLNAFLHRCRELAELELRRNGVLRMVTLSSTDVHKRTEEQREPELDEEPEDPKLGDDILFSDIPEPGDEFIGMSDPDFLMEVLEMMASDPVEPDVFDEDEGCSAYMRCHPDIDLETEAEEISRHFARAEAEVESRLAHPLLVEVVNEMVGHLGGPSVASRVMSTLEYPNSVSTNVITRLRLLLNWWDRRFTPVVARPRITRESMAKLLDDLNLL